MAKMPKKKKEAEKPAPPPAARPAPDTEPGMAFPTNSPELESTAGGSTIIEGATFTKPIVTDQPITLKDSTFAPPAPPPPPAGPRRNEAGDIIHHEPVRKGEANEAGDRFDGRKINPVPPPPPKPKQAVPTVRQHGYNEAGDPIQHHQKGERNASGDRFDGAKNPPPPPPRPVLVAGLPPGAIGRNRAGDPVFPQSQGPNEAGDRPVSGPGAAPVEAPQPKCGICAGRGRVRHENKQKVVSMVTCQDCGGSGLEKR